MTTSDPFATVTEVQDRLDWTLSADEQRMAAGQLDDLSDLARYYGRKDWAAASAPRMVKTTVLRAVVRFMRNPDAYTQSRAGDETVAWADTGRQGGAATFEPEEINLLRELAGMRSTLGSAPATAWGPVRRTTRPSEGHVPAGSSEKPFPLFGSDASPW